MTKKKKKKKKKRKGNDNDIDNSDKIKTAIIGKVYCHTEFSATYCKLARLLF